MSLVGNLKDVVLDAPPYRLRPIEDTDIDWVFRALSDPQVYKYYGVRFLTLEATREQMTWYASLLAERTGIWFAIQSNAESVGAIGFNDYHETHRGAEVGYWLLPPYWGRGVMKTVFPPFLQFAFQQCGLHRMEAVVETENAASAALIKKFGFQYEGTRRECEFKDGRYISDEIYGLLAREYQPTLDR